ncbi:hypothetical protein OXYTRIMIC_769 [Oxytricha trifallax]|uniref:Uncharacterized protein n=1 Tax=Oxytricha trifallax TaxID=1172189 RepID=A0A073ICG3_9SPIT|nr:hypothetical protein OXYTRIMIC_769 [Oxytricha trifallax]
MGFSILRQKKIKIALARELGLKVQEVHLLLHNKKIINNILWRVPGINFLNFDSGSLALKGLLRRFYTQRIILKLLGILFEKSLLMQTKSKPLNKRKRGRPRKTHIPNTSSLQQEVDEQQIVSSEAISQNPCEPRSFHAKSNLQNPKQPKEVGVLRSQLVYMPIESEEEVQIEEYSSLEIAEQVSNYLQGYTTVGKGPLFEIFDPRSQVTRFLKSCEDSESLLPKSEILRLAHLVQQWAFPDVGNFTDDLPIYDHQNEQEHSVQSQEIQTQNPKW